MPSIFIGIDGGGTHTTAAAYDGEGRELARVQGGAGLVRSTEPTAGAAALADLTDQVLRAAGLAPPATALCCGLAGAGRPQDKLAIAAALQREAIAERIRVVTDGEAAFHDAFAAGPGVLLIAGTGSIALGRNRGGENAHGELARGELVRVGGWGTLLGDEGSGYAIGLAALRACAHAHDGRAPETALLPDILAHLELSEPRELIHWGGGASKREIAALAPVALAAAEAGDPAAHTIAEAAVRELVAQVESLTKRLAPWQATPTVALTGGLIARGGALRDRLLRALEARCADRQRQPLQPAGSSAAAPHPESAPRLQLQLLERAVDAARGAATLARER